MFVSACHPVVAARPRLGERRPQPPFWELEALIAAGLDRAAALAVMAARRESGRELAPRTGFVAWSGPRLRLRA